MSEGGQRAGSQDVAAEILGSEFVKWIRQQIEAAGGTEAFLIEHYEDRGHSPECAKVLATRGLRDDEYTPGCERCAENQAPLPSGSAARSAPSTPHPEEEGE